MVHACYVRENHSLILCNEGVTGALVVGIIKERDQEGVLCTSGRHGPDGPGEWRLVLPEDGGPLEGAVWVAGDGADLHHRSGGVVNDTVDIVSLRTVEKTSQLDNYYKNAKFQLHSTFQ